MGVTSTHSVRKFSSISTIRPKIPPPSPPLAIAATSTLAEHTVLVQPEQLGEMGKCCAVLERAESRYWGVAQDWGRRTDFTRPSASSDFTMIFTGPHILSSASNPLQFNTLKLSSFSSTPLFSTLPWMLLPAATVRFPLMTSCNLMATVARYLLLLLKARP